MTRKEIAEERARRKADSLLKVRSDPYDDLACREMINSCLCYYSIDHFWEDRGGGRGSYADPFIEELGLETVKVLAEEQIEDFKKARVRRNVFTDSEGCTYNGIIWADEQEEQGLGLI